MNKLQYQRKKANFSQSQLATLSNVKLHVLQCYEQGVRSIDNAKIHTLASLALALDCHISDIIENEDTVNLLKKL